MPLRLVLAVNVRARRGRDARDRALAALRGRGHEVEVITTDAPAELSAAIAARRGAIDAAVVGGGDGTLIAAIAGLREADVPLVILPLGTINELARTLAIPVEVEAACALLDEGIAHRIDVGCVNGFWFFNEASIGLSTHVAKLQTGEVKSRWGMLAIPIATVRALRALRPYHLEVEDEGGTRHHFRTVQLTVANSHRFGGVVENVDAGIDDGQLDLYSIDLPNAWAAVRVVGAVALKRFPNVPGIETARSSTFTVRGRHPHQVFADGEPATELPAEFSVVPGAIAVYVPR